MLVYFGKTIEFLMNHTVITLLFLRLSNSCVSLRLLPDTGVLNARFGIMSTWSTANHFICFLYEKLIIHSSLVFTFLEFSEGVTVAGSPKVHSDRRG